MINDPAQNFFVMAEHNRRMMHIMTIVNQVTHNGFLDINIATSACKTIGADKLEVVEALAWMMLTESRN